MSSDGTWSIQEVGLATGDINSASEGIAEIAEGFNSVADLSSTIVDSTTRGLGFVVDNVQSVLENMITGAADMILGAEQKIADKVEVVSDNVTSDVVQISDGIGTIIADASTTVAEELNGLAEGVNTVVEGAIVSASSQNKPIYEYQFPDGVEFEPSDPNAEPYDSDAEPWDINELDADDYVHFDYRVSGSSSSASIPGDAVPAPLNDTSISEDAAPVPSNDASIPEAVVPAPSNDTSIPEAVVPAPSDDAPIPEEAVPAPSNDASIPEAVVPAPSNDASIPEAVVPAPSNDASIPEEAVPAASNDASIPEDAVPMPSKDVYIPEDAVPEVSNDIAVSGDVAPAFSNDVSEAVVYVPTVVEHIVRPWEEGVVPNTFGDRGPSGDDVIIPSPSETIDPGSSASSSLLGVVLAINAGLTASRMYDLYEQKQGPSTVAAVLTGAAQIAVPAVAIGVTDAILAAKDLALVSPESSALIIGGALVCSGVLLAETLYYNKFFVKKQLKHIEEAVKNMPKDDISLEHKKSLVSLINNSLYLLNGNEEQGIKKTSQKVKELDLKVLFNLNEMKKSITSPDFLKRIEHSSKVQKNCKEIHKRINKILEHSLFFSLLIRDLTHIQEIYARLNMIKEIEKPNNKIQAILDKISPNNKLAKYEALLETYKNQEEYAASKKGKLRAASKALISCIPEKKGVVQFHKEVISLAPEMENDYQEIKTIINDLRKANALKSELSKQELFDICVAFRPLSYREALEQHNASLIKSDESLEEVHDKPFLRFQ